MTDKWKDTLKLAGHIGSSVLLRLQFNLMVLFRLYYMTKAYCLEHRYGDALLLCNRASERATAAMALANNVCLVLCVVRSDILFVFLI